MFTPNDQGFLDSIQISLPIADHENSYAKIEKGDGTVVGKLTFRYEKELMDEIIYEFQKLESILAFTATFNHGSLQKICWDQPIINLVAENEHEKRSKFNLAIYNTRKLYQSLQLCYYQRLLKQ